MKSSADKYLSRQRGVSLVEILIVLSIAAMVAGIVIINAPPARSSARESADQLAVRIDLAAQEAVTGGALIGMTLNEEGYSFYRYSKGDWSELDADRISGGSFSSDDGVALELAQPAKKNEPASDKKRDDEVIRPNILMTPTGETTPVTISFSNRNETVRVSLDNAGHVEVTKDDRAR